MNFELCVATRKRSLVFYRWSPQQRRLEENKDIRGAFDLIGYSTYV